MGGKLFTLGLVDYYVITLNILSVFFKDSLKEFIHTLYFVVFLTESQSQCV